MTKASPDKPTRVNIQLPADLEETYANMAMISHSASEIILDFARIMPNTPKGKIHARVVMTPLNAKLLFRALAENLQKFEATYGEIKIPQSVIIDRDQGFTN